MLLDLDSGSALDPARAGFKAASIARAAQLGFPVAPGFVVEGSAAAGPMRRGAAALAERGSGGARLVMADTELPFAGELVEKGLALGDEVVARSSTVLEGSSVWSGAFTSYVDIAPADLPRAVVGCWASAFTVAALERQEAAGVEPGSFPFPVLVQRRVRPRAGGWAEISESGRVGVYAVAGDPAPLLQGWVKGLSAEHDGRWRGDDLTSLMEQRWLDELAVLVRSLHDTMGVDRCEWALSDRLWVLQVGWARPAPVTTPEFEPAPPECEAELTRVARWATLCPGPLGEELVLPWALGVDPSELIRGGDTGPGRLDDVVGLADELMAEAWRAPADEARREAGRVMSVLRGPAPQDAVADIRRLDRADPEKAGRLLDLLDGLRAALVTAGAAGDMEAAWSVGVETARASLAGEPVVSRERVGVGRWEPLLVSVVFGYGRRARGVPAAPGVGAGRAYMGGVTTRERVSVRRRVVCADLPAPHLAPLLWDAAAIATSDGSPAAHLFESARSLGVPAVCAVEGVPTSEEWIVAVDGDGGTLAYLDLGEHP